MKQETKSWDIKILLLFSTSSFHPINFTQNLQQSTSRKSTKGSHSSMERMIQKMQPFPTGVLKVLFKPTPLIKGHLLPLF